MENDAVLKSIQEFIIESNDEENLSIYIFLAGMQAQKAISQQTEPELAKV